ncbi:hypothetical protein J437_LFUL011886 [Ladona fulva]|uniref:Uncharacterized protein n=1 Tax=Ladona fulva TaxID=123851 RepID=A0A8K0P311_LADFU|nr:hypothetical protein J437_LFUL011886 [Ladona fulva]
MCFMESSLPEDTANKNKEELEYEEEIHRLRPSKTCQCCTCMDTMMENLPKFPSATEIIKSQSLTNILHNQNSIVNESRIKLRTTPRDFIQTREQETGKLVTYSLEILNFQGHQHSPEEIAPLWKKDCRTWLWKTNTASAKRRELYKRQQN